MKNKDTELGNCRMPDEVIWVLHYWADKYARDPDFLDAMH